MAQNYGLGRGLASLIPQKQKPARLAESRRDESQRAGDLEKKITQPQKDFNYFGVSAAGSSEKGNAKTFSIRGNNESTLEVEISKIIPNPHQPRIEFNPEKLKELSDSIKEHGIIQPIIVSKNNDQYEIIAGERRLEAAKLAGLKTVPVILRDATEKQKLELAITENIQRHDLNPVEEAKAYLKLVDEFDLSQEEVAMKVGKSRSAVANKLRLLNLPVEIQKALISGSITEGHAKAILAIENPEKQRALYDLILKNNLTVRQTENKTKETTVRTHKRTISVDPEIRQIEDELSQKLGTKVKLTKSGGGGKIVIEYYSKEELGNILDVIKR